MAAAPSLTLDTQTRIARGLTRLRMTVLGAAPASRNRVPATPKSRKRDIEGRDDSGALGARRSSRDLPYGL